MIRSLLFAGLFNLVFFLLTPLPTQAQTQRDTYLQYIERAAEEGWEDYPEQIAAWKQNVNPSVLWGYNSTSFPIYLADVQGFLYQETGDEKYARRAITLLAEYGDLRDTYPEDFASKRAEYVNGLPSLTNFFFLPPYSRSYLRIKDSPSLDDASRNKIEMELAHSLDFVFHFPEWGAHNRAMLRAEGLIYGSLAMPDHPNAAKWKKMAAIIAQDNLQQWEIEDASIYHPVWLLSLLSYADMAGHDDLYNTPLIRYYAEYFKRMFTPADNIPDFGDANWNPSTPSYIPALEQLANRYQDAELKWIAARMFEKMTQLQRRVSVRGAAELTTALEWMDASLTPEKPTTLSQEVLDDVVGKKVVFRNGWEPTSTYLMLNYRDEGEGGLAHRDFLRNTITVEEEKMHHGHSDENSITLLMDGGSVLLHDGGYRDGLPSGPFGSFRADYFHNRLIVRKDMVDRYQTVPDFIRNQGAYRPVRTQKVDFMTFEEVDMSRTRLIDDNLGYIWDRVITYLKPQGMFLVVDAVRATRTDFFTYTNLWHTQHIHEQGDHYYDTSIDSIQSTVLPPNKRLLIQFLETRAKTDSTYDQVRHFQDEKAIYQTQSSHYRAGDLEVFVTALIPHDASQPASALLENIKQIPVSSYPEAIGFEIADGSSTAYVGIKLDLDAEIVRENIRPRYTWASGRTQYGPFETDAHFLYGKVEGGQVHYAASQVLQVRYQDETLMEALPHTWGLQPDGGPDRVGYMKWRAWEDTLIPD